MNQYSQYQSNYYPGVDNQMGYNNAYNANYVQINPYSGMQAYDPSLNGQCPASLTSNSSSKVKFGFIKYL